LSGAASRGAIIGSRPTGSVKHACPCAATEGARNQRRLPTALALDLASALVTPLEALGQVEIQGLQDANWPPLSPRVLPHNVPRLVVACLSLNSVASRQPGWSVSA
jgi:hypothetical protein